MTTPPTTTPIVQPPRRNAFLTLYIAQLIPSFIFLTVLLVVTLAIMLFVVPKFRETFNDFRTTLPPLTILLLNLSNFIVHHFGWLLILPTAFLFPLPLALAFRNTPSRKTTILVILLSLALQLLLFLLSLGILLIGLFLPLIKLIQSISTSSPGA